MEKCEEPLHFGVFFSNNAGELHVISFNKKNSKRRDQEASPRPTPYLTLAPITKFWS